VKFGASVEQKLRGSQYSRQCAGCHDPVSVRLGDTAFTSGRGITCIGCHDASRLIRAGGNSDFEYRAQDWAKGHKAAASAELERLRSADFCAVCHQQFVPGNGIVMISTFDEWRTSPFGPHDVAPSSDAGAGDAGTQPTTLCVECHMARNNDGVADHTAPGGNVYLATKLATPELAAQLKAKLHAALKLSSKVTMGGYIVTVKNVGIGHSFPTGVTDIREPWVEIQALDARGNVLQRYGGPDNNNLIPASAGRLGLDIAQPDGTLLYLHELTDTTRIPFDRRVPAGGSVDVTILTPNLPAMTATLEAVLYYRNVRTQYFRAATGDANAAAPDVEIVRSTLAQ